MIYNVLVIGGGPAGYRAACKLSSEGIKTGIVDFSEERLGGTCLNEGCIPVKTFLEAAHILERVKNPSFAILTADAKVDLDLLGRTVEENKKRLRQGILYLLKNEGVEFIKGKASFVSEKVVKIKNEKGENFEIEAERFIVATGSMPKEVTNLPFDGKVVLNSTQILQEKRIPSNLLIAGGGAIGCEFASFYNVIGSRVTLIEMMNQILPGEDEEISRALRREMEKKGIEVLTETTLKNININRIGSKAEVILDMRGTEKKESFEKVLLAIGRKPSISYLNLQKAGVEIEDGYVKVNKSFQTSNPSIYAAGDVIRTPMLAHVAYREGILSALACMGNNIEALYPDYGKILQNAPRITYTLPQVASVGLTGKLVWEKGIDVRVTKTFFRANGKAVIEGEDYGFLKLFWDKEKDILLGASIIGASASELIHIAEIAIHNELKRNDLKQIVFGHPTIAEIFADALE